MTSVLKVLYSYSNIVPYYSILCWITLGEERSMDDYKCWKISDDDW